MTHYVALLRGITPTNPSMKNQNLRMVFEHLGFTDVKTIISSGNVIFKTPKTDVPGLESQIEQALQAELGFFSSTIIRSAEQINTLVNKDIFKGYEHNQKTYLTVTFLKHAPSKIALPSGQGYEIIKVDGQEVFSIVDLSTGKTPNLMTRLERQFGSEITTRTWKTVLRLQKTLTTP